MGRTDFSSLWGAEGRKGPLEMWPLLWKWHVLHNRTGQNTELILLLKLGILQAVGD